MTYDEWLSTNPNDRWLVSDEGREEGCTCSGALGAGGRRKTDKWCPLHGIDPDEAYERMRDDQCNEDKRARLQHHRSSQWRI